MLLPVIHYLHVTIAALWAGSVLFVGLGLWPVLARIPMEQAAATFARIKPVAGPLLGGMAGITYLLGVFRAWVGGGIAGWSDLLAPYGLLVIAAVVIMMGIESVGGRFRRRFAHLMDDPAAFAAEAPGAARRAGLIQLGLMLVLIGIMVTMGLSLY